MLRCAGFILLTVAWALPGCLDEPQVQPQGQADPLGVLTNPHFAISLQQDGRKIPIRNRTAVLRRGPFDILVALPTPGGVFVNADTQPSLHAIASSGGDVAAAAPLRAISENASSVLTLGERTWQYWYYLGPGISKFTDVREVGSRGSTDRTWVCKKALRSLRTPDGQVIPLEGGRGELYLVFIKAEWDASHTERLEQSREALRILFR